MPRPPEFSFRTREKNLEALACGQFDILVIGGGITGAGVARDAALRGLSVALLERKDFAAGTSSRSSKLIHGGLRYLQQGDVGLVREAATERHVLRRLAPHLARPMQMLMPLATRSGYAKIKVGLWTYDRLAGVSEEEQYRMLSREEALALEPTLRPENVYGAGLYYEYVTDDARLVMETMKSAAALGAVIVNHCEVAGFICEGERVTQVTWRDRVSGAEAETRARVIINAAGPWVDEVRLRCETGEAPRLRLTKGIHVGLRPERLKLSRLVVMNARDKRGVFAIPKGEITYLGTTDTDYDVPCDYPAITVDDVLYLLEAAERTFTIDPISPDEVVSAWAGLRPLLQQEGKKPSELSRKDEIMTSPTGLLSVAGGKLTTFRRMAQRIVDLACEQLKAAGHVLPHRIAESEETLLSGGETGDDIGAYTEQLQRRWGTVPADVVERLVQVYGSNAERMVEAIAADPVLGTRAAPAVAVTQAEVDYAVREEMALTLEDYLERRGRLLLWSIDNGVDAAESVARWMAATLGWSPARIADEVAAYQVHARQLKSFQTDAAPAEPARAAHA